MALPTIHKVSEVIAEDKDWFVKVIGDEDNFFKFEKSSKCKKPIVGLPVYIVNEKAFLNEKYDALIEDKYHLISIKNIKKEQIEVESVTTGLTYQITTENLRP